MIRSQLYRCPYTRTEGMRRTYDVTFNLTQRESGVFAYAAWVHHGGVLATAPLIRLFREPVHKLPKKHVLALTSTSSISLA
ncbi:hypothetical protein OKW45_004330 [Paraburkholderia sp. WSM4175]